MKKPGIESIARNAAYLSAGRVSTYLVRGLYVVVLARYLGPEVYGIFAYGQAWYLVFLILSFLGLDVILSREIGRDREVAAPIVAETLALRIVAVAVAATASILIAGLIETNTDALRIIAVFSLAIVGRGLAVWIDHLFIGYESAQYSFGFEAIFRLSEVVVGLAIVASGGSALAIAAVHAITWWVQAGCGLIFVRRHIFPVRPSWNWRRFGRLLSQGVPIGLHGLLAMWLLQGPLLLYRHVAATDGNLGQLALVMQALVLICVVPTALSRAALPVLSRAVTRKDGKDKQFADELLPVGILVGASSGLSGMGAGPWLVELLFGPSYGPAGALLGSALWLVIPMTCAYVVKAVLLARGENVRPMVCALAGGIVFTIALPVLVGNLGIQGAVVAAGAGLSVWALGLFALLTRLSLRDIDRSIIRPGLAVFAALAAFYAFGPMGNWPALAVSLLVLFGSNLVLRVFGSPRRLWGIVRSALPGNSRAQS